MSKESFREDLERLINRESKESGSDTPDFILAEYLTNALIAFDAAIRSRDRWYGHKPFGHLEPEGDPPTELPVELEEKP